MMIFRLKESDADKKHVLKILNHLSDGVITDKNVIKLIRIGKRSEHVRLSHDLTREQRNELKKFLEEAQKKTVDSKGDFLFKVRGDVGKWRTWFSTNIYVFFNELISVLEHIIMMNSNIILMGDFNVHVERMDDPHTIRLLEIFDMFDLVNHVKGKTHSHGGTLDLIVSSRSFFVAEISIHPSEVYSDHGCIVAKITIPRPCGNFVKKLARSWKDLDEDQFKESILKSAIAGTCQGSDVEAELILLKFKCHYFEMILYVNGDLEGR
ncbi:hypothetical protein HELRODRAFT_161584 [Helobdella robusta]|uniref:Endonuclease/exonuclease/phosphatase domain-containing protein n=1 Tax=Helobdella robusta TaxID=6412 RepID=T1ERN4_HELRO|nr:hypothetical protein HELRODRAFT_161584 [Helobdella robusta]ESO02329.1 hypothetical protein HELRODRAFT_161584 [Helobdella robusta]